MKSDDDPASVSMLKVGSGAPVHAAEASRCPENLALRQVLTGQTEAYGPVFDAHQSNAYGLAYYYTQNREDALDVVQDAFVKAFMNLNRFDLNRSFGPWLLSIVRNLCIDLLRRRKFSAQDVETESLQDGFAHQKAEKRLMGREVWSTLGRLDPRHREIIVLKDYLGYSYLEISDILSIPIGTVMSRLHQARKRFKSALRSRQNVRKILPN